MSAIYYQTVDYPIAKLSEALIKAGVPVDRIIVKTNVFKRTMDVFLLSLENTPVRKVSTLIHDVDYIEDIVIRLTNNFRNVRTG